MDTAPTNQDAPAEQPRVVCRPYHDPAPESAGPLLSAGFLTFALFVWIIVVGAGLVHSGRLHMLFAKSKPYPAPDVQAQSHSNFCKPFSKHTHPNTKMPPAWKCLSKS